MGSPPKYFIPYYGNYYHFVSESCAGCYNALLAHNQAEGREVEFSYSGPYAPIVQVFSCLPVRRIEHWAQVPAGAVFLPHFRPKTVGEWRRLQPLSSYLLARHQAEPMPPGITVIRRVKMRMYADHGELVRRLAEFGLPVREAVMEELSFDRQIALMRSTLILVGPHGSGETNMIFMPAGALVLELFPKGFFCRVFQGLAAAFGHRYSEIEATQPSQPGRPAPPRVRKFMAVAGWPTRSHLDAWKPDRMELGRVLRDVRSFSIEPTRIMARLRELLATQHHPAVRPPE